MVFFICFQSFFPQNAGTRHKFSRFLEVSNKKVSKLPGQKMSILIFFVRIKINYDRKISSNC